MLLTVGMLNVYTALQDQHEVLKALPLGPGIFWVQHPQFVYPTCIESNVPCFVKLSRYSNGPWMGGMGSNPGSATFFSFPQRPDRFWDPSSLSKEYRGLFARE
jgi:hypothetical protein